MSEKLYGNAAIEAVQNEMEFALKSRNIPVNKITKLAYMIGAQIAFNVSAELADQQLMDLGGDKMLFKAKEAILKEKIK